MTTPKKPPPDPPAPPWVNPTTVVLALASVLVGIATWWSTQTWRRLDLVEGAIHLIDARAVKLETIVQSQSEFNSSLLKIIEQREHAHGAAGSPR